MQQKFFLLAAIALCTFNSCVLEQDIHFNEDFSGDYSMKFDMSSMDALADDSTQTEEMSLSPEDFKTMEEQVKNIPGITDVVASFEESTYTLKYKFSDLATLTKAGKGGENEPGANMLKFTQKGKKLLIDMTPPKEMTEGDEAEMNQMENMGEMFSFRISMKFDKPIAKVKTKLGELDKPLNIVNFNFGLKEFFDKKTNWKTQITFE